MISQLNIIFLSAKQSKPKYIPNHIDIEKSKISFFYTAAARMSEACCQVIECFCSSPVGNWRAEICESGGLHLVKLADEVTNENFLQLGDDRVRLLKQQPKSAPKTHHQKTFEQWMKCYFTKEESIPPPICPHVASLESGKFRQCVWLTLQDRVGFGQTTSYGELARMCGKEGAGRVQGSA